MPSVPFAQAKGWSVSVVTVVLNGVHTLGHTIDSVVAQKHSRVEYIVVDGGSTDGTLDLIAERRGSIDKLLRGPDSGIAEAMNKGLQSATGDLVLFLHADDCLAGPEALAGALRAVTDLDHIWAFDVLFGDPGVRKRLQPRPFNLWSRFRNPLPHQGVLMPRRLYRRFNGFEVRYRIAMDYALWLKAIDAGVPLRRVFQPLSIMGAGGISSRLDWPGLMQRLDEERAIQRELVVGGRWRITYAVFWPCYLAYRWTRALQWRP